jgi:hypothetical protein
VLCAADTDDSHHLSFEIRNRFELRARDEPEERPMQRHGKDFDGRASLYRANRARNGSKHIDFASDRGDDRNIRSDLNQPDIQTFGFEQALLLPNEVVDWRNASARVSDRQSGEFLR